MTVSYQAGGPATPARLPERPLGSAMRRGALGRCPNCGVGRLFASYITVADRCEACGEDLHHHRADDLPAYLTIVVVGHIVVPAMYMVERAWHPELWVHMALWLPMVVVLSLALLRPIKGAVVGLQWANYMHGFDPRGAGDDPEPIAPAQP